MKTLRHLIILVGLFAATATSNALKAQSVSINNTGALPDTSAILDVSSTEKGFLMPRMTTAQMNSILDPADGLIIYNSTDSAFFFFNGNNWEMLSILDGESALPDTLGVHLMTSTLVTDNNWVSGDGDNEGFYIDNNGKIIVTQGIFHDQNISGDYVKFVGNNETDIYADDFMTLASGKFIHFNVDEVTTQLSITDSGVGLGTISPNAKLDVVGSATIDTLNINDQYTLPATDGTSGQYLKTDGSGNVSWAGVSSASPNLSSVLTSGNDAGSQSIANLANIDIGTSSVAGLVGIYGSERNSLNLQSPNNSDSTGISWQNTGGNYVWTIYREQESTTGNAHLIFAGGQNSSSVNNLTERLRISNAGNVGIAANSPSYKLDVNGAIRTGTSGTDGQFRIFSEQGTTDYEVIMNPNAAMTQNTTYTLPANDGNANQMLTTDGSGALSWTSPSGDGNGIYDASGSLSGNTTVTQAANTLAFTSTATNGFSVDGTTFSVDAANNRVGLGTSAPSYALDVNGAIRTGTSGTDGQFRIYSEQGTTDYEVIMNPNAAMTQNTTYTLPANDGNANQMLTTDGSGALSWTSPSGDGNGIYDASGSLSGNRTVTQASHTLAFTSTATNGFSVDGPTFSVDAANNRVGIGTTTPSKLLTVNGNGAVSIMARFEKTTNGQDGGIEIQGARQASSSATDIAYIDLKNYDANEGSGTEFIMSRITGYTPTTSSETGGLKIYVNNGTSGVGFEQAMQLSQNGVLTVGSDSLSGSLSLYSNQGATDYTASFAPSSSMTQNTAYTLPTNDGNANQMLTTNGSGVLSWTTASGDGNGIYDASGSLSGNTIVTQAANTLAFTSTATNGFSVDGTTFSVDAANNRVGLGTSAPTYALDVNGAIRTGTSGTDGQLRIYSEQGTTDYEVIMNPNAAMTQNTTYTLPANDGNANQMLTTNGSGVLSWTNASGDGNGIYDASGSLSGNTIVTQAANTLAFTSTSTNGFSVDGPTFSVDAANNRVGIGTSAPTSSLTIRKNEQSALTLKRDASNNDTLGIAFQNTGGIYTWNIFQDVNEGLHFSNGSSATITSLSSALFLENGGQIGVNNTSPSYLLDVNGTFSANSVNVNNAYTLPASDGGVNQVLTTNGSGVVSWAAAGSGSGIYAGSGSLSGATTITGGSNQLAITSTIQHGFSVDGSTFSVDASADKVGIGTSSPVYTLDVFGQVVANEILRLRGGSTEGAQIVLNNKNDATGGTGNSSWNIDVYADSSLRFFNSGSSLNPMRIGKNGYVGINKNYISTFTYPLEVGGEVLASTYLTSSDRRYKKDIESIENGLEKIIALRPVSYNWRQNQFPDIKFEEGLGLGFIAQEVEEIIPEIVQINKDGYYSLQYTELIPILTKAIQEQQALITQQNEQIKSLESNLDKSAIDNQTQNLELEQLKLILALLAEKNGLDFNNLVQEIETLSAEKQ